MSKKYALKALFAEFIGFYITWICYHFYIFLKRKIGKSENNSNYKKIPIDAQND